MDDTVKVRFLIQVDKEPPLHLFREFSKSEALEQKSPESVTFGLAEEYFGQLRRPLITALTNAMSHGDPR